MTLRQMARLRKLGLLKLRDGDYERHYPNVRAKFVARVEAEVARLAPGADTIVPRKRRGRRRRGR